MKPPIGLEYLPYQEAGIEFATGKKACLIGDEPGLGKTIQAIGAVNETAGIDSVLVVCPASLKINWRREIDKWAIDPCVEWTITNYDQLHKLDADHIWDLVIFDESHYLKNHKAKRSVLSRKIGARMRIMLTGTPILNRPIELWHLLHILDPWTWPLSSRMRYALKYCGAFQETIHYTTYDAKGKRLIKTKKVWNMNGASNLAELNEKLQPYMIRRTKAEVLKDLPPKRRQIIELSQEKLPAAFRKALRETTAEYRDQVADLNFDGDLLWTKLSEIRHETARQKLPMAIEFIQDALEASEKVVIFAHHRDVIEALIEAMKGYNPVFIHGSVLEWGRQRAVDVFQTDPACRVFIGQIQAAGVGLTLTAAGHVIFLELDWVPGNVSQAEDRCHRIGQTDSVLVQHLVLGDSLDALMAKTLVRKQKIIDKTLNGGE